MNRARANQSFCFGCDRNFARSVITKNQRICLDIEIPFPDHGMYPMSPVVYPWQMGIHSWGPDRSFVDLITHQTQRSYFISFDPIPKHIGQLVRSDEAQKFFGCGEKFVGNLELEPSRPCLKYPKRRKSERAISGEYSRCVANLTFSFDGYL
jgi:hypothetical protein